MNGITSIPVVSLCLVLEYGCCKQLGINGGIAREVMAFFRTTIAIYG